MAIKHPDHFKKDNRTALQSVEWAQYLAFAPVAFQAARVLRTSGLLSCIEKSGKAGISYKEAAHKTGVPVYGARVLMEAGLGIGLLTLQKDKFKVTKAGSTILSNPMTVSNMDFIHDVCYKGLFDLDTSIQTGRPEGLKTFGSWNTVYEALSQLPQQVQESWFSFDHYYSDTCFDAVLPHVFRNKPAGLLDIGGNTGKWAAKCVQFSKSVHMGIADLPGQLNMAKAGLKDKPGSDRVSFFEINLLDPGSKLPRGFDAIWMSQFLDCFSEEQIISILKKCSDALPDHGCVFILEPLWDRQKYETSAFCLQMTSLYFTAIANGNSQMYSSELFSTLIQKGGFYVEKQYDNIGISHSLLVCKKTT